MRVNFAGLDLIEGIAVGVYDALARNGMPGAELTVLDPKGVVLVDYDSVARGTREYRRDSAVTGRRSLVAGGLNAAKLAVDGKTGGVVALHSRKQIAMATGYSHGDGAYDFPGIGLSLLVRVPVSEAFDAVDNIADAILYANPLAIAVMLPAGLVVGALAVRPLDALAGAMNRLAEDVSRDS